MRKTFHHIALLLTAGFSLSCSAAYQQTWVDRDHTLEELRAARADLSLYDGAPLVIPHGIVSLGRENCLNCHAPGSYDNGERIASPRPHPAWSGCRQCHLERYSSNIFQPSDFQPLRWQAQGHRQSKIAPPMIPHHIQNRQDCAICHIGYQAHPALRAAHGYRAACLQCHIRQVY